MYVHKRPCWKHIQYLLSSDNTHSIHSFVYEEWKSVLKILWIADTNWGDTSKTLHSSYDVKWFLAIYRSQHKQLLTHKSECLQVFFGKESPKKGTYLYVLAQSNRTTFLQEFQCKNHFAKDMTVISTGFFVDTFYSSSGT